MAPMRRRLGRVLVVSGLVAALVAVQAAPAASGDEGDEPVGYTMGFELLGPTSSQGKTVLQCNFYEVDLERAEITRLNAVDRELLCADGLTFDEDGELYAYRNLFLEGSGFAELITIDLDDGDQTLIGRLPNVNVGAGGMTFDAEGDLWLYAGVFDDPECSPGTFRHCLWEVDPEDASTEFVGSAPQGTGVFGLAGDCEEVLALTSELEASTDSTTQLQEVDTRDASLEPIAAVPTIFGPQGLDFDDDDDLWAIGQTDIFAGPALPGPTVFLVDPEDGSTEAEDITFEGGADFNGVLFGLGVSPISCEEEEPVPPAPPAPAPAPIAVEPVFTG
jgi:hypothetical protein